MFSPPVMLSAARQQTQLRQLGLTQRTRSVKAFKTARFLSTCIYARLQSIPFLLSRLPLAYALLLRTAHLSCNVARPRAAPRGDVRPLWLSMAIKSAIALCCNDCVRAGPLAAVV